MSDCFDPFVAKVAMRSSRSNRDLLCATLVCCTLFAHATHSGDYDIVIKDRAIVQRCVTDKDARNIAVGMLLSYEQRESGICGIE